eukprot:gene16181-688_t
MPCNYTSHNFFMNLPPHIHVLVLYEIRRPKDRLKEDLTRYGWTLQISAGSRTEECVAIAFRANAALLTPLNTSSFSPQGKGTTNSGACWVDIIYPQGKLRVSSVYAHANIRKREAQPLGEWIMANCGPTHTPTVIMGDFNCTANTITEAYTMSLGLLELVQGRTTFQRIRAQVSTSIDRCFVSRQMTTSFKITPNALCSDHAQLLLELPYDQTPKIQRMSYPPPEWKCPDTVQEFMKQASESKQSHRMQREPSKLVRLKRAVGERLQDRWRAIEGGDVQKIQKLNREIKDIKKKISFIVMGKVAEMTIKDRKLPFKPPHVVNQTPWIQHFRKRFSSEVYDPAIYESKGPIRLKINPQETETAIKSLLKKEGARTQDISIQFLKTCEDPLVQDLSTTFEKWLLHDIPEELETSLLFPALKPGKKAVDATTKEPVPESHRPICIMNLLPKIFAQTLFCKLREIANRILAKHNFQQAGGWLPGAMQKIILKAQEWLMQNEDNVIIIADLEAAYDSIPHAELLDHIEELLGLAWRNAVAIILKSQRCRIAFHEGPSTEIRLGTGLLQGSALSVPLFLLYVMKSPFEGQQPKTESSAYMDDLATQTTIQLTEQVLHKQLQWARSKKLTFAPSKLSIVTARKVTIQVNGTPVKTVQTARLLGACLHAKGSKLKGCQRFHRKVETLSRKVNRISTGYFTATIRKAQLFSSYGLSTIALHCLSRCFEGEDSKLVNARQRIVPKHAKSKGYKRFVESSLGYKLCSIQEYVTAQRLRALTAAGMPMKAYKDIYAEEPKYIAPTESREQKWPKEFQDFIHRLAALGQEPLIFAHDGGYHHSKSIGSIGMAVQKLNSEDIITCGLKITGTVTSSTHSEAIAGLAMHVAFMEAGTTNITQGYTDSEDLCKIRKNGKSNNPVAKALRKLEFLPEYTWNKGHADNKLINACDDAEKKATHSISVGPLIQKLLPETLTAQFKIDSASIEAVQFQEIARFYRRMCTFYSDWRLLQRTQIRIPIAKCRQRKHRYLRWAGVMDLLQSMQRHSVGPERTRVQCVVPGCSKYQTMSHILQASDERHLNYMGQLRGYATWYSEPLTPDEVIAEIILKDSRDNLLRLAARIFKLSEDPPAKQWA